MALFECPECGRNISDKARTCPGCGAPVHLIRPHSETQEPEPTQRIIVEQPIRVESVGYAQNNQAQKKKENWRGFWVLLMSAGLGVVYSVFSICYWSEAAVMTEGLAESIGAGIATGLVMPHLICAVLATLFNIIALFSGPGFALTGAILYTVSGVLFLPYILFVIIQAILSFIGFARKKTS